MFSACANPECRVAFNYRQGCLFRFQKDVAAGEFEHTHAVRHFWLCGHCCQKFTLEYKDGKGVVINRTDTLCQAEFSRFIAAA